jgi:Apea-like HEPN
LTKITGKRLALDLLYYCRKTGDWQPDYANGPLNNLLNVVKDQPDFKQYFSWELAYDLLNHELAKADWQTKTSFTDADAEQLLARLAENIEVNAVDHWIIVPLRDAELQSTIHFKDFAFIGGTRDEKIEALHKLCRISHQKVVDRVEHTETSRSPGFFAHPLLAIRIKHQTHTVECLAKRYALWCLCALHAVYWGYVYPANQRSRFRDARYVADSEKVCQHLCIYAQDDWRWGHQPFISSPQCSLNLDWLRNAAYQRRFIALFMSVIKIPIPSQDKLTFLFYRSLRFFGRAISIGQSAEEFEGMGISLLYLMIAAEGVLLNNNYEKRLRLSVLLPRLAKYPGYTINECTAAIDRVYKLRSDFVHSGTDFYSTDPYPTNLDPDPFSEEPAKAPKLSDEMLVRCLIAKLLSDAPRHLERVRQIPSKSADLSEVWFDMLNSEWHKVFGLE